MADNQPAKWLPPTVKYIIVGHARHGKDTIADLFAKGMGLSWQSSSMAAAEHVVMPYLAERGISYSSLDECFEDRYNHRKAWYDAITEYNTPDKTRLARKIFETNDIYVGMRNREELLACKEQLGVCVIWVDASLRLPPEPASSMTIKEEDADFIINNNGSLSETLVGIGVLVSFLRGEYGKAWSESKRA